MAKQLDPKIADVLKEYGFGEEACWDCHGTWVVYHKVLEQIARKAGVFFQMPFVTSADPDNVAICVTGEMGDSLEWSIGEAAPKNNKNVYPWAMAEKRAKDRVILKLIGLHGDVYSEDEADDFKKSLPDRGQMHGPLGITELKAEMKTLGGLLTKASSQGGVNDLEDEYKQVLEQCERDLPVWFEGKDGSDVKGMEQRFADRRVQLEGASIDTEPNLMG